MGDDATERRPRPTRWRAWRPSSPRRWRPARSGFSTSRTESHLGAYGKPVPSRVCDSRRDPGAWPVRSARLDKGTLEVDVGPRPVRRGVRRHRPKDIDRPVSLGGDHDQPTRPRPRRRRSPRRSRPPAATCTRRSPADPSSCRSRSPIRSPFANVAAFGEILALEHEARPARYADPGVAHQGPHRRCRRPGATSSTSPWCRSPSRTRELIETGTIGQLAAGTGGERHRRDGRAGAGRGPRDPLHRRHDQRQRGRDRGSCSATTTSCSACPTPGPTPASCATPTTRPTCCSTGGGSGGHQPGEGGVAPHRPARRGLRTHRPGSHRSRPGGRHRGLRRRHRRHHEGATHRRPPGRGRPSGRRQHRNRPRLGGRARTRRDGEQLTGVGTGTLLRGGTA